MERLHAVAARFWGWVAASPRKPGQEINFRKIDDDASRKRGRERGNLGLPLSLFLRPLPAALASASYLFVYLRVGETDWRTG